MRKQDYAALAQIIRESLAGLGQDLADRCTRITLEGLATRFAERASVDRAAFLKACGLKP